MMPTYLSDSGFFEKTERIDWSTLKAYEGKLGLETGEISHNPFDVEYVRNIPHQASDSFYKSTCTVYFVTMALQSDEGKERLCDNDDPPRPKNTFLQSPDESAIVTLE
ncbi:hypothetical protein CQW23_23560 [Capsicum baccatum]|uniref:Uncharacterized protein n=1 Tax=Capsicum baccatum TaxID=33114 RepID=A0A2G2VSA3_CAPBA|nr:hypothetical protein CQW23_23560 [Capsicum baccatum]